MMHAKGGDKDGLTRVEFWIMVSFAVWLIPTKREMYSIMRCILILIS